jgi:hypothetical protein
MRKKLVNSARRAALPMAVIAALAVAAPAHSGWLDDVKGAIDSVTKKDDGAAQTDSGSATGGQTGGSTSGDLPSLGDMSGAFKQALEQATTTVVSKLGVADGFNADPQVRIPLPDSLDKVVKTLDSVGLGSYTDDLQVKLNRAAEEATPKATALFMDAITAMTFEDVKNIYQGPADAATRYFQEKMSPALATEMQPIVSNSLSEVGAVEAYDKTIAKYKQMPLVPDVKANLTEHVVNKGMEGIFHYLAEEEGKIRKDPGRWTTDLLESVFGSLK